MTTFPQNGDTIRFTKVPAASYCRVGEAYRVERAFDRKTKQPKGDFWFISVERGSSTCDKPWAVKSAEWVAA